MNLAKLIVAALKRRDRRGPDLTRAQLGIA